MSRIRTDWETHTGINNNNSSNKILSARLTDAHAEETASGEAAALISRRGCTQVKRGGLILRGGYASCTLFFALLPRKKCECDY